MAEYFNHEKYPDPTAYKALKNIEKQERKKKKLKLKKELKKYGDEEIPISILRRK